MLNKKRILCCVSSHVHVEYSSEIQSYVCALETGFLALYDGSFYYLFQLKSLPHTCKHINSPKNDIKTSLGYFHITGTLPMSLNCVLKFLREARGNVLHGNIPRDSKGKEGGTMPPAYLRWKPEHLRMTLITKWNMHMLAGKEAVKQQGTSNLLVPNHLHQ